MGSSKLRLGFGRVALRIVLYCVVGMIIGGVLVAKSAAARSAEAADNTAVSTPVVYRQSEAPKIATTSASAAPATGVGSVPPPPSPTTQPPATAQPRPVSPSTTAPRAAIHAAQSTSPAATGYGCGPALAYLQANSAPGFQFECPGYAQGHQAMTCVNVAGVCPGIRLIAIHVPCAAAYMNEAHNSWVVTGLRQGSIDPYGYCH